MPSRFDPDIIRKALISPRWAGQVRLDASPAAIARWDKTLVRDTRVLVPIDVQALYVPAGDTTHLRPAAFRPDHTRRPAAGDDARPLRQGLSRGRPASICTGCRPTPC